MGNRCVDTEVLQENDNFLYEQSLQRNQYTLSIKMRTCLMDMIFSYLSSKKTITHYEGQMIQSQRTDLQKATTLIQTLLRKGRRACQQFYEALECFDPILYKQVVGSPAKCPTVDHSRTLHERVLPELKKYECAPLSSSPPPVDTVGMGTTYVVIQNSVLNSCIIGSNNTQLINMDQQCPLPVQDGEQDGPEELTEKSHSACGQQVAAETTLPHANVQIHGSNLQYVIIGDMNKLTVEEELEDAELEE